MFCLQIRIYEQLKLKLHKFICAPCSGQPRHLLRGDRSQSYARTLTPAEAGTHFTDNWKPESSLSAPVFEPRPSKSTC